MSESFVSVFNSARLALGSTVIVYLLSYNEACGPAIFFANIFAVTYALMAAYCKSSLNTLQMPYIRASNKFDYTVLFLATWMDVLSLLCACATLARTMSTSLDAMTGGMAHIFLLGRNSSPNEPWPDILGVAVVILITAMFMLGLENSHVFHVIMWIGMFIINSIPIGATYLKADIVEWTRYLFRPNGLTSLLTPAAILVFAYPSEFPMRNSCFERFRELRSFCVTHFFLTVTILFLSTVVTYKTVEEYIANPLFTLLDEVDLHKLVPAVGCVLMLTSSAAYLQFFPELYGIIVRFATSEWKVLSRQISYESPDSGSPVLAIFISGSLCAMLAFACPMQHLILMLAASYLVAVYLRAFYLLYIPYRPKYIQRTFTISSLEYSRLPTGARAKRERSASKSGLKRSLLNVASKSVASKSEIKIIKHKKKAKKELEKEWLLLGEPTSPCPTREPRDVESAMQTSRETPDTHYVYPEKVEATDTESSTDIDAIVDEYRQKVRITTTGLISITTRVPTVISWRLGLFFICLVPFGSLLFGTASILQKQDELLTSGAVSVLMSSMLSLFPRHKSGVVLVNSMFCSIVMLASASLYSACAYYTWPAIVFWTLAGLMLLLRCDNWCCSCFEQSGGSIQEQLIPSDAPKPKALTKSTTIHIPGPPTNLVTIPTHVNAASS
ncbi:probable cationic amino acid transporter [Ceratitis capitata]|uniref:probable cationic amino acid transporter n=1 Tax=Ceratitis capitata TaxID=7213 RepID=UPI00061883E8|nr:probable cationic amino acid transporter [Ceratitis capitata]